MANIEKGKKDLNQKKVDGNVRIVMAFFEQRENYIHI